MPPTIRPITQADIPAVLALWQSTPEVILYPVEDTVEVITRFVAHNPRTCFVAEKNGEFAGAILGGFDGRRGYIYHMCVRADCRHCGLGRTLAQTAIDALSTEGVRKIALFSRKDNAQAMAFWSAMGLNKRDDVQYWDLVL
ncbi:MAG: GNAT family N-acetyltransferase [Oscillospiraceae bacterium]|jgi:ribosomal protein S18 acetylase RimI-like enzyme|nr:GNAT family N-acetyltransferase [Oscillospiraceae bacterium]